MQESKNKILFIFNQILSGTHIAGGEVRGLKIFQFFSGDPGFLVNIMLPKGASFDVVSNKTYFVGENFIEKYFYTKCAQWKPFMIFILYFIRTFESFKHIKGIDADIIYSTGDFFCDTVPAFFIKFFHSNKKWVCCVHHINERPLSRRQVSFINALVSYLSQRLSFLLIRISCDQVFAINTIVKESLAMRGIIASKIYVVGNGLDVRKIDLLREESRNIRKENKICFFSRLSPSKGVLDLPEILFEVLKRYPDYKLEIIGSVEKNVVEKINEGFKKYNCVNNVNILGFMDNKEEAFKRIMLSKVIIFPTYEEGWGLALFEAVLLKIPVIVYKLPIFDELFGENIESANVGNRKAFAEKIMFCLEPSNSLQVSKKVESCYEIAKKYDWSNVFNFEKQRIQLLL